MQVNPQEEGEDMENKVSSIFVCLLMIIMAFTSAQNIVEPSVNQDVGEPSINQTIGVPMPSSSPPTDWPMFHRTNDHQGYTPGDGPTDSPLLWDKYLQANVIASPAAVDGRIYINGFLNSTSTLYCLKAQTGDTLWEFLASSGRITTAPTVADGYVYFGKNWGDGKFYCLDAYTGAQIWEADVGDMYIQGAVVVDDVVYVPTSRSGIYALYASNGTQIWWIPGGSMHAGVAVDGDVLYGIASGLKAIDRHNGSIIWTYTCGYIRSTPTVAYGKVFVQSNDEHLYAVFKGNGTLAWKYDLETSNYHGIKSSVAAGFNKIFVGCQGRSGGENFLCFNPENGTLLWSAFTSGTVISSPAIAGNGIVYVASGTLFAFYVTNGTQLWSYYLSGYTVGSSPAIYNEVIYISSSSVAYAIGNYREPPPSNQPPVADAGSDQTVNLGDLVQFDGSGSYDPDGNITIYEWDFGDGSPHGSGVNPTHTYNTTGNYTVTLTVWDNDNASDDDTCIISVQSIAQQPIADAGLDQTVDEGDTVLLNGSGSSGGTSLDPSVVGLWHLNEGSGNMTYDETANHNDGAISGAVWDSGRFGSALSFDGYDDYVDCGNDSSLNLRDEVTIEAWVYPRGYNLGRIVSKSYFFNYAYMMHFGYPSERYFKFRIGGSLLVSSPVELNRWYHVVGTFDGAIMRIYVNGNLSNSKLRSNSIPTYPNTHLFLGSDPNYWQYNYDKFNGIIDEVVIYKRALTSQEILDYYNSGREHFVTGSGGASQIVSYEWDFESDGIYDYQETPDNASDGNFDGMTTHVYGDNGLFMVTLRITNDNGMKATDTCNITVNNVNPTVDSFGPFVVNEGSPLTLSTTANDQGSDDLIFTWNFEDGPTIMNSYFNDGIGPDPYPSPYGIFPFSASDNIEHTYGDDGVYGVSLKVEDDDGGTVYVNTTVTVNNISPGIKLTIIPSGNEGSSLNFTAEASDSGSDDLTFQWEFEYGPTIKNTYYNDGVNPEPVYDPITNEIKSPDGTYPFNASDTVTHTYGDDYNYTLILRVTDDDGGLSMYTTTISIYNLAPSIILFAIPLEVFEGSPSTYIASAKDHGSDDLTFEWDFGDSTPLITNTYYNDGIAPDPDPSPDGIYPFIATDTLNHTYGDNYNYTLGLTVTDDDGGITSFTTTVIVQNVAPTIEPFGPFIMDEGLLININAISSDLGSDDLTFTWEFDLGPTITNTHYNDGANPDPYPSPWGTFPFSVADTVEHTYGDDGIYPVTLTVMDDDGGTNVFTTNITVNNFPPSIDNIEGNILANFTLRIAGEKWHNVELILYEDDREIGYVEVVRYPGSPDDQSKTIGNIRCDVTKTISAKVFYTPDDDPINGQPNGANPCWVNISFEDGSYELLHHTFNVRHPETWEWDININQYFLGHVITFQARAEDPGSDDLTFHWSFGSITTYFNDGIGPDPYPSPDGVFPFSVTDIVTHLHTGPETIILTVSDDDGGTTSMTIDIL
jgi:outer membrane protein assembly factor BamB